MPLLSPPCSRNERAAMERIFSWFSALCSAEYRMAHRVREYSNNVKYHKSDFARAPTRSKRHVRLAHGANHTRVRHYATSAAEHRIAGFRAARTRARLA